MAGVGQVWNISRKIPVRTSRNRSIFYAPKVIPKRAHPLVKPLFKVMMREGDSYLELARRSGVSPHTVLDWQRGRCPEITNLEACLNVYSLELSVRRIRIR